MRCSILYISFVLFFCLFRVVVCEFRRCSGLGPCHLPWGPGWPWWLQSSRRRRYIKLYIWVLLFRFNVTTRKGLGCSAEVQNTPRQRHIFCYTPFNSCNSLSTLLMVNKQTYFVRLTFELKTVAAKTLCVFCILENWQKKIQKDQ